MTPPPNGPSEDPDAPDDNPADLSVLQAHVTGQIEAVYRRVGPGAYAALRARGATRQAAEDILHNAVVNVSRRLQNEPIENIDSYFMATVLNAQRDWWRKADNTRTQPTDTLDHDARDPSAEEPMEKVIADHDRRHTFAAVRAALQQLTERQQNVFVLRHVVGLSNGQVGTILGLDAGNVRYHLSVGRAQLTKLLELNGIDGEEDQS